MRPIQTLAPGFLGLLGMKQGQLPPELVDQVMPTLEILPFYLNGARETIGVGQVAAQNVSGNAHFVIPELTVPAGQVWYVHGFTALLTVPGFATAVFAAEHLDRNTNPIHATPMFVFDGAIFGSASGVEGNVGGFFAMPGDLFGILLGNNTAILSLTGSITFMRMIL